MITREQVADLQAGDVVEYAGHNILGGAKITGPITVSGHDGALLIGGYVVRFGNGDAPGQAWGDLTLNVISRAKRSLYVNSDKTEPDPGDVVRDAGSDDNRVWAFLPASRTDSRAWGTAHPNFGGYDWLKRDSLPTRLRLLVDGRTGQVVP